MRSAALIAACVTAVALIIKPWIARPYKLSSEQWDEFADAIWSAATADKGLAPMNLPSGNLGVILSISDGRSEADVATGNGKTLADAANAALASLRARGVSSQRVTWLKAHVVTQRFREEKEGSLTVTADRSLYGLGIVGQAELLFSPEEVVAQTLVSREQEAQWTNIAQAVRARGLTLADWGAALYQFATDARFHDGRRSLPIFRGHRRHDAVDQRQIDDALRAAGEYLLRVTGDDGRFIYSYRPKTDAMAQDYNILRHAGTIYAMMELFSHTKDVRLHAAVGRAIRFLLGKIESCISPDPASLCVVEAGTTKLGGNALVVVALSAYARATGDTSHLATMRKLVRRITSVQAESGEFSLHKQSHPEGREFDFKSDYYPGEAILALLRFHALSGEEEWLSAAVRGADWLIKVRDAGMPVSRLEHDHWLLYGLAELYEKRPEPLYAEHARKLVDAITAAQITAGGDVDWIGGFAQDPGSTPTACRAEGLMAAYRLFRAAGDSRYALKALDAARLAARMMLSAQIREESAMYFRNPPRALGGFGSGLSNYEIRIDYVQHNVSALLALRRAMP